MPQNLRCVPLKAVNRRPSYPFHYAITLSVFGVDGGMPLVGVALLERGVGGTVAMVVVSLFFWHRAIRSIDVRPSLPKRNGRS